jgi:TonB family protein
VIIMKRAIAAAILVVGLAAPVRAQDPLAAARDLYAAARYDEALAMLNGLRPQETANSANLRSIEQYRSLCLIALGRGAEAETAIAAVVASDPLYQPSEDSSPRVRTAFSEVRQRALPDIARSRYATAKATFDRKEHSAAEHQFRDVLRLLDDPDMGGRLGDLRVLVTGFLDLSVAAAAPPPEPKKEEAPAPAAAPPAAPAPEVVKIYTADDEGVAPATPIRQDVPRVPTQIANQSRERGMLDVTIDEQGRVISATLRLSLHPIYDAQLLAATREWRYSPAMLNGRPVKFRKIIQITVTR